MAAAVERMERSDQVLVIAPQFLVPTVTDYIRRGITPFSNHYHNYLRWSDTPDGPWQYGATVIAPTIAREHNVSSLDVLDAIVERVVQILQPHHDLQSLTIVGYSSGGQLLQRWALLTTYFPMQILTQAVCGCKSLLICLSDAITTKYGRFEIDGDPGHHRLSILQSLGMGS